VGPFYPRGLQAVSYLVDFLRPVLVAVALMLAAAGPVSGQGWTRFHGPNGSGESPAAKLPDTWSDKDYRWKVALPGVGHSSPVIWGRRIFVTSASEEDGRQIVECLETADGSPKWKRELPGGKYQRNALNSYASSTPAVDADRLYVSWLAAGKYTMAALDQTDGREVWRRDVGPFAAQHGFGASPIVVGGLVVAPNEQEGPSSIVALDCRTGEVRWTEPRKKSEKAAYSTPCTFRPEGGPEQLIFAGRAHGVSGLDPQSGKTIWELPIFQDRVVGSPVIVGGLVIAQSGEGGVGRRCVAVRPGEPAKAVQPKLVYDVSGPIPYVPTPVAKGDLLFLWSDAGIVSCLDAPTGKLHWRQRVGGSYFSSPVRVGDRLYNVARDGLTVVLAASSTFAKLGESTLGEPSQSTPAVSDGVIYFRTVRHLMALGALPPSPSGRGKG
jgi:outer membrane protein assembly factor BamB